MSRETRWTMCCAVVAIMVLTLAGVGCGGAAPTDVPSVVGLEEGWTFRQEGTESWYEARVPGCVHTDLLANELIPDPFYRTNEQSLQWIERADWEYRTSFDVAPEMLERAHAELVFAGLDTYATVRLNGQEILDADNMFRTWRVDVAGLLRPTGNLLEIAFRSPVEKDLPRVGERGYELPVVADLAKTSPYTRKAAYHYGWDWGPRFVTAGVWRPVRLEAWDGARISDVQVVQREVSEQVARLTVNVEVEADGEGEAVVTVAEEGSSFRPVRTRTELHSGVNTVAVDLEVAEPRLWWPAGLGDQPLYRFTATLSSDGVVKDARTVRTGLRSLELVREPDQWGESFRFVVNGVPVFAKGANWIPADSFPPRVTRERYRHLLRSAVDANMNMLRVWGGGIYESDDFYELCDELGIMVWQDFMFACNLYPGDEAFLASVRAEAVDNVRRLRNHPSIALWCGNNEVESAWREWGWEKRLPAEVWGSYQAIFQGVLPEVVAEYDPTRPYWPSSPSSSGGALPRAEASGDIHHWEVWHGRLPFADYEKSKPRFVSEYGFQSFPEMATVDTFALPEDRDIASEVMLAHQKNGQGNEIIHQYLLREFPEPPDFATFLYLSQVLQARGIALGSEHFRRLAPRCMGALYWQLDDCWPVASWSSIDYEGRWKALHYYARRFFAPVLVSPVEEDGELRVYVVSDRRQPLEGRLAVRLLDFAGNELAATSSAATVRPLASRVYVTVPIEELLGDADPHTVVLYSALTQGEDVVSSASHLFVPFKELALPDPAISAAVGQSGGAVQITLRAQRFASNVALSAPGLAGSFSDNYFDLLPGQPVTVEFRPDDGSAVDAEAVRTALQVRSMADAL